MTKTKMEVLKDRVHTFARKNQLTAEDLAISGNHGLLGLSETARDAEDTGVVSTLHLLLNPAAVKGDGDDTIFDSGLWCGVNYTEENFAAPSAFCVYLEEKVNLLVYPLWPELGRVELDGLWFADHHFLAKAKTVSLYNKHHLKVFNHYMDELGRYPSKQEEEYLQAVRSFDEYYHYSDDISVFRAGKQKEEKLKWLAEQLPNHQQLWAIAKGAKE